ncbi:C-type lectin domain family 4 member E [Camponotus floridanus]|nr:C-type lectin domain family 4 member E [Camponotus floridanus]
MPRVSVLLFLLITCAAYLAICDHCCVINYHELPRYNLIKTNWRSNQPIISRKVVFNVEKCEEFAASKRALAFNLVSTRNRAGKRENMCQALQCPEDRNMTTLVPAANYKYYSMYSVSSLPENTTIECIPKAGMFIFSSESLNYTQAQSFCRKRNSSLAHVISEERTEGLVKFVSQNRPSFVGLSNKEGIWKNDFGESLSCFDYRAWGEGQPSHRGCVTLVNPPAESSPPFWKVVPCYVSLPFICEISPSSQRSSQKHNKSRHRT